MNANQSTRSSQTRATWIAVGLALLAALAYLLIAWNILGVGDLNTTEAPPMIVYVAAGCYIAGGLLILLRNRPLLIFGVVINAAVMLFFFDLYRNRPAVLFSPGGLITKAAQLVLEGILIYLIAVGWQKRARIDK